MYVILIFSFCKMESKKHKYIFMFITWRNLEVKVENYRSHSKLEAVRSKKERKLKNHE